MSLPQRTGHTGEDQARNAVHYDKIVSITTAWDSAVLTREYVSLRTRVDSLKDDVERGHTAAQDMLLADRTKVCERFSMTDLLERLSLERGMAWRDIARLVGVTVAAVRKWRNNGSPSPEKRLAVARLVALLDLLEASGVQEPVAWLSLPVVDGYTIRHLDIYEMDRADLIIKLAESLMTGKQVLDQINEHWREDYRSDFEVFTAGDGQLSIGRRSE